MIPTYMAQRFQKMHSEMTRFDYIILKVHPIGDSKLQWKKDQTLQ